MSALGPAPTRWPAQLPTITPLGTMLRRWRVSSSLSQNQLARRVGIDPASVNRLEARRTGVSRVIVLRLAAVLGLDAVDTDLLLIASGHCPEIIAQMAPERFRALSAFLGTETAQAERLEASSP